jgi:hypothetical protein
MSGQSSTYQLFVMFGIVLVLALLVWRGRGGRLPSPRGGLVTRLTATQSASTGVADAGGQPDRSVLPTASGPLPTDLGREHPAIPTGGLITMLEVDGRVVDTKTLLKGARFTAGRAPTCTIRVEDLAQTRKVSRNHLTGTVLEGGVLIENTASVATICLDDDGAEAAMRQGEIRRLALPATVFLAPDKAVRLTLMPFGR